VLEVRVLIAGGGTGGHLYPGIAIAQEVTRRPGGKVLFVGTARGLETRLVPAAGFQLELIQVSGLKRVGVSSFVKGVSRLPRALFASARVLGRFRPDLVMGVGGYASGPVVLTAALLGYPTAILEQNSYPGITNRILGRFVRRVFIAFEGARGFFAAGRTLLVGNPVRRQFVDAPARLAVSVASATPVDSAFPLVPLVLVVGGSQGARAVNDLVIGAAAVLSHEARLPRIVHQTGAADEDRVRRRYAELGLTDAVQVRSFIEDMYATLATAALVVGRAGALTLAELAMVGCPAILIPLPTAADDHQTRNAVEFVRVGAAVIADQRTTTSDELAHLIADLCSDPGRRAEISRAIASLGRPHAASEIVDDLERLTGHRAPDGPAMTEPH
jgi:UDP-N-acetylglucosamine--N-acetylmuramyl-(pentapeptide) pyrophosphoryl-undecaprenol N-acetylglucosamine transferase